MEPRRRLMRQRGDKQLLAEEQRVEGNGFGQRHTDDGLNEDLAGCAWVTADSFDGLGADEAYANGGGETAERALNATTDFCDGEGHDDGWMEMANFEN
jgi:hypothetical protein